MESYVKIFHINVTQCWLNVTDHTCKNIPLSLAFQGQPAGDDMETVSECLNAPISFGLLSLWPRSEEEQQV
ncbi:hypothetical protein EXN66_Car016490 [Channa argus]|uniref:Uncharacterized protein n=1 Tax=Channa argus TaxID=215402 RepID=A0A6G1QE22_CHAAH|nr:hypothetical protein EXN66_Car016490 [Channa argus]